VRGAFLFWRWQCGAFAGQQATASEEFDGFSFITGEEIDKLCRSGQASDQRTCAMYICGMVEGWQVEWIVTGKRPFRDNGGAYCLRAGVTCQELSALVPRFLDENPRVRQSAASGVVLSALVKAFPCPSEPSPPLHGHTAFLRLTRSLRARVAQDEERFVPAKENRLILSRA